MVSATVTASSRLLKQDQRYIIRGAMLKRLGTKPEVVVVSPILHMCLSSDLKADSPQLTWQQMVWHAQSANTAAMRFACTSCCAVLCCVLRCVLCCAVLCCVSSAAVFAQQ